MCVWHKTIFAFAILRNFNRLIMKRCNIFSILLALLLSSSAYAQTNISYLNVNYEYDPSVFTWTDETMGTLSLSQGFVANVKSFEDDGGAYYMEFGAGGTLTVSGRVLTYTPRFKNVANNATLYFGNFSVDDNSSLNALEFEAGDNGEMWEVNDPERQYWFAYNIAKLAEDQGESKGFVFVRGSEIPVDVDVDYCGYPISHVKYENELFYSQEEEDGEIVYKPIYSFDVSKYGRGKSFTAEYVNSSRLFKVNEIPANAFDNNGQFMNLIIGSSITSIKPDLSAKTVVNFDVEAGNQNYSSALGGDILCNKNGTTVYGITEDIGTKTLPASVNKIAKNAMYSTAKGVKLTSTNENLVCNETNLVAWTLNENADASSLKVVAAFNPTAEQTIDVPEVFIKESSKSNGSTYTSASVTKKYFVNSASDAKAYIASLAGDKSLCYVDLSNCKLDAADLGYIDMATVNANCLLFLPEGVTATGNNIVTMSNGVRSCANLVLTRATGYSFATPYQFKAANVSVNATISDKILGFVLPFDYTNSNVKFAKFSEFSEGSIVLDNTITTVPANIPFIVCKQDGADDQTVSATNADIYPTEIQSTFSNGWTMSGSYQTVTNNEATNYNLYGFATDGVLKKANGASFKPFSSFFVCNTNAGAQAKVRFVSDDFTTGVDIAETIFNVTAEDGAIKVVASDAHVVIASVNGVVLYDGKVNGTMVKDVNSGVYVVNGKKIVVNK